MSATPRLYVSSALSEEAEVALDEGQSKYLTRVLRLDIGAPVRVFNGRDGEWDCVLSAVTGRTAHLLAKSLRRPQSDMPPSELTLLFAPLKKTQTDFVIEKATELGVGHILPVITARTQTHRVRPERLEKIALEAAEQTERLDLPSVSPAASLQKALAALEYGTVIIFCDEAGDDSGEPWGGDQGRAGPMLAVASTMPTDTTVAILIGPEGGFSPEERNSLRARSDTYAVSLGPRILRAETAVVAALTLWQAVRGDWQK